MSLAERRSKYCVTRFSVVIVILYAFRFRIETKKQKRSLSHHKKQSQQFEMRILFPFLCVDVWCVCMCFQYVTMLWHTSLMRCVSMKIQLKVSSKLCLECWKCMEQKLSGCQDLLLEGRQSCSTSQRCEGEFASDPNAEEWTDGLSSPRLMYQSQFNFVHPDAGNPKLLHKFYLFFRRW